MSRCGVPTCHCRSASTYRVIIILLAFVLETKQQSEITHSSFPIVKLWQSKTEKCFTVCTYVFMWVII